MFPFTFGGGQKDPTSTPSWMTNWYSKDRQDKQQERDQATGEQSFWDKVTKPITNAFNSVGNQLEQKMPQATLPPWLQQARDFVVNTSPMSVATNLYNQSGIPAWLQQTATSINNNPMAAGIGQAPLYNNPLAGQFYGMQPTTTGWTGGYPPQAYTPPRLDEGAMAQDVTDPIAKRMEAIALMQEHQKRIDAVKSAQNYNWFNGIPNQSVMPRYGWGASTTNDPEDQMWKALRDAGLDTAQGQRYLKQVAGPNWQRALLRSLTPITQPAQQQTAWSSGGGGYYQPSYGGGGGGYSPASYKTPTYKQNTPAWANGLVNWRIA